MPDETELAWAAGFLDGEGHFGIRKHGIKSVRPYVEAMQGRGRFEALFRLRDILGGCVEPMATHPRPGVWRWRVGSAAECRQILPQILPYLVTKQHQAQLVYACALVTVERGQQPTAQVREFRARMRHRLLEARR